MAGSVSKKTDLVIAGEAGK
ncbi:hypothetical protein ACEQPO_04635 [Bacillus sp. SL00103]